MNISERASELRRLRAEATKGEWKRYGPSKPGWDGLAHMWHSGRDYGIGSPDHIIASAIARGTKGEEPAEANAALIVAAANSVDELARFCEEAWPLIEQLSQGPCTQPRLEDVGERDEGVVVRAIECGSCVPCVAGQLLARYSSEPAPKENP